MERTSVTHCQKRHDDWGDPNYADASDGHVDGWSTAKIFDYIKAVTLHDII
jgi:hypothetical protein